MTDSVSKHSTYLFKLWSFIIGSILVCIFFLFLLQKFVGPGKVTKIALQADLQTASAAIKTKDSEINRLAQDNKLLQNDLETTRSELTDKYQNIEKTLNEREKNITDLQADRGHLKSQLTEYEAKTSALTTQLSDAKNMLTERDASIASFTEDIKKLGTDLEATRLESKSALNQANDELQAALLKIEETEKTLSTDEKLQAERNTRLATLEKELKDKNSQLEQLQQQVTQLDNQLKASGSELNQKLESTNQLLNQRDQTIVSLEEKIQEMENKRTTQQNEADTLNNQLQGATATLSEKEKELIDYKKQVGQLQEQIKLTGGELGAKLQSAGQALSEREKVIDEMNVKIDNFKNELETQTKQIDELTTQLRSAGTLITERDTQLKDLQQKVAQTSNELRNVNTLFNAKDNNLEELKNTLTDDFGKHFDASDVSIKSHMDGLVVGFSSRALFRSGSTRISTEGMDTLKHVAQLLKGVVENHRIRIVGHTDPIPLSVKLKEKYPSNWELSTARAAAVVRYLILHAEVDPAVLEAVGASSYQPISTNETPEGRANNRRIEMVLMPLAR